MSKTESKKGKEGRKKEQKTIRIQWKQPEIITRNE
jgi:hypothetical protein